MIGRQFPGLGQIGVGYAEVLKMSVIVGNYTKSLR